MSTDAMMAFFAFAVVAAVTPGPSNLMVMIAGARAGLVGGLACLAGVVAGMALLMGLAASGLGSIVKAQPSLLLAIKGAGALFLLWLAWQVSRAGALSATDTAGDPVGFWKAFAFQWVNPKSWIVGVSASATFAGAADTPVAAQALSMALVFALAAAPSCGAWLLFGAVLGRWLSKERNARVFNIVMGVCLAASVVFVLR